MHVMTFPAAHMKMSTAKRGMEKTGGSPKIWIICTKKDDSKWLTSLQWFLAIYTMSSALYNIVYSGDL